MSNVYYGYMFNSFSILFCRVYVSLTTHSLARSLVRILVMSMAPRYRTKTGFGLTCSGVFRVNNALVQYDASGTPTVINSNDPNVRIPYLKCPTLTNPTAGMATSTNNTMITKKMRYAQLIRVATETKNVKKVYAVNNLNRFGSWPGAPGGYGAPVTNSF